MSALADVELFGEDFVVEAGILVKELQKEGTRQRVDPTPVDPTPVDPTPMWDPFSSNTHKFYSVARLDVLKLGDLHL